MANSASSTVNVRQPSESKTRWSLIAFGVGLGLLYAGVLRWIDAMWPPEHPSHLLLDWSIPTLLGVGVGLVLDFARNRSERYRAEQQALEGLRGRLRGSEREQAVWVLVSSLLHELRNPLHTVGLALEELRACQEPDRQARLVERAGTAVERMNQRFRELGAIADQPLHELRSYDLGTLVQQTVEHFDRLARGGGAKVSVRGEPHLMIRGDEAMVRTALENLVSNAVDAVSGARNGEVDVTLECSGDTARIRILDNGPGVPETMKSEIFKPLRTSKAPQKGLGLGLPIARGLARASGGDVRLEASQAGACFLLELPLSAEVTE
ncbi:MAG: sensor histidine kinase [Polyangiaceae bacterium]